MALVAQETGLGRESLYKSLSADGDPEFATVLKVVRALGLRLHATAAQGAIGEQDTRSSFSMDMERAAANTGPHVTAPCSRGWRR